MRLEEGDLVLLPRAIGHIVSDSPRSPATLLRDLPREWTGEASYRLRGRGSGARALLVCCGVSFEAPAVHPLLQLMPEVVLVPRGAESDPVALAVGGDPKPFN